ncbi:MAG TPA: glycosyltransferase, partial [Steroidobacteraceae bacterium]
SADLFLQHSVVDPVTGDEEGLPVAILEASASALPVVSTVHAGIPEAVDDGVSGFLVKEGDVQGMADAIVALASDGQRRIEMGLAGWRRVREQFSTAREREAFNELLNA